MKRFIKQFFCRHEYQWYRKIEPFYNLSGETQYLVCMKCGYIKNTRFIRNEE